MNRLVSYTILAFFALISPYSAFADDTPSFGFGDSIQINSKRPLVFNDAKYKSYNGREIFLQETNQHMKCEYLPSRRALTGNTCYINKIVNTVDVGAGQKDLDHLLNDDLNDYAEIITVAKVGVGYNPVLGTHINRK
ncbi:MAG: hypothetical protein NC548_40290 [Lachnospiraceae bacterium]|nr:hypothetical protein [Lachnospiraceae bacterium]